MSDPSSEIEALRTEIRSIPMTFEPVVHPAQERMPKEDRELMKDCYHLAMKGDRSVLRPLKKLIATYPDVPSLKNYLSTLYDHIGRHRQADTLTKKIVEEHPDYLFGRLNLAASEILRRGKTQKIPELLGSTLSLTDFQPDVSLFHFSEVRSYYNIVARYYLENDRNDLAKAIHEELVDLIGEDDKVLQGLLNHIRRHNLEKYRARLDNDNAKAIRVTVPHPKQDSNKYSKPDFNHSEIDLLYRYDNDIQQSAIETILALPRKSLVSDLEAVLLDCIRRSGAPIPKLERAYVNETFFGVHALLLLAELEAEEALPTVLETLSLHQEYLLFWFHYLEDDFWDPLFRIASNRLEEVKQWMLSPAIPSLPRDVMATSVGQIAHHEPERRDEIVAWFGEVLEFLDESPPKENILDTDVVDALVWECLDLGAHELTPVIERLYEKNYLSEVKLGDWEEIYDSLREPPISQHRLKSRGILERYSNRQEAEYEEFSPPSSPLPENAPSPVAPFFENDFASVFSPSFHSSSEETHSRDTGRNDPCPCGSGKKYKKCCMRSH